MNKIKFDFSLKNKDCDGCITCPTCNSKNVNVMRALNVEFDNEKSTGFAIQFFCEEGHFFYQLFETYKGHTQTAFTDDTTVLKKIIIEDIDFKSSPISLQKALKLEDLEEKYFLLDEYGEKAVDSILDIELLRSLSEQPYIDEAEIEFDWITQNLPDIAPKSLDNYRQMKSSNSKNYQNIVRLALKNGFEIK